MCMTIKCKKDHDEGTRLAPELLAKLYTLMKEFGFDVDIQDPTRFAVRMCDVLSQAAHQDSSKLRKNLSYHGMVECTKREFLELSAKKQLKGYFVIGKANEIASHPTEQNPISFLAAGDYGNFFYDSWCRNVLCFDTPLNVEHTADLVEALLALHWLQFRAPDMEHQYGTFTDLKAGLTKSLREYQPPTLAAALGDTLFKASAASSSTSQMAAAQPRTSASGSAGSAPPPPHAMTQEGKKQERIATATALVVTTMKDHSRAVKLLRRLVETPAEELAEVKSESDEEAEAADNAAKRKSTAEGGDGSPGSLKVAKLARDRFCSEMYFLPSPDILEGDDKEAALAELNELVEEPTSAPCPIPPGVSLLGNNTSGIIDLLYTLPDIDLAQHNSIKAKTLALLRHSNPSMLPMSSYWVSIQHLHSHHARTTAWDFQGKYLLSPWHLMKELALS